MLEARLTPPSFPAELTEGKETNKANKIKEIYFFIILIQEKIGDDKTRRQNNLGKFRSL